MEKRIIFRVPDAMYKQIIEAVKQGKAKTPSALIRASLKEFLEKAI